MRAVSLGITMQLMQITDNVSFQHNALGEGETKAVHPLTVGIYINLHLNMLLEIVKNRVKLKQHFERFAPGGSYGHNRNYAILDIDFKKDAAKRLSPAITAYASFFFFFCVKARRLYDGNAVPVKVEVKR